DLVTFDSTPLRHLHRDPRLLNRVGVRNGDAGMLERKLPDLRAGFFRMVQPLGTVADFVVGKGHLRSVKKRCREMINMLSETDQTELTLAAPQNFMPFNRHS